MVPEVTLASTFRQYYDLDLQIGPQFKIKQSNLGNFHQILAVSNASKCPFTAMYYYGVGDRLKRPKNEVFSPFVCRIVDA